MYGSFLKEARRRAGLSAPQAAERIGVGEDAVYRYERDANSPSLEVLDRMAGAYGVLIGDLLPNSGAGGMTSKLEPLMAAFIGLTPEEIEEEVNLLAQQARVFRNSLMRRGVREMEYQNNRDVSRNTSVPNHTERVLVGVPHEEVNAQSTSSKASGVYQKPEPHQKATRKAR